MRLWALDLAKITGFAYGEAGAMPKSGSVRLAKKGEGQEVALVNFTCFLRDQLVFGRPDRVYIEHYLNPKAQPSQAAVLLQVGLYSIAVGVLGTYGIEPKLVWAQTWRKHFIGTSNAGEREATKRMTVRRAHQLRMIPFDCFDDNRADACGLYDFACKDLGLPLPAFQLFEQTA